MTRLNDIGRFALRALTGYPLRTSLMLLAMAIGVASVVVLTSLGEGTRRYVTGQFASLGTNLLIVLPGRAETTGGPPPLTGETPRDLTIDDALALLRSRTIRYLAPVTVGSAPVSWQQRDREVMILGSTSSMLHIRHLQMSRGRFLPESDPSRALPVCVLGHTLTQELFGNISPIGQWVRIGDKRFRVIGILAKEGVSLGLDMDDLALIPVASAQALFNTSSLFRILVEARERELLPRAKQAIIDIIRQRHDGEDDITVITQDAVLATFDRIFTVLTLAVGGIAAISLVVAGVLVMNVMLVAISQRTAEIGLLKALGAPAGRITILFLTEAAILSLFGAVCGILIGYGGVWIIQTSVPQFPVQVPSWALAAAFWVAITTGLVFGIMPARRAARLDAVQALARR
jgi:putative ABC transport system permease protein